jgi:hypothetical protein
MSFVIVFFIKSIELLFCPRRTQLPYVQPGLGPSPTFGSLTRQIKGALALLVAQLLDEVDAGAYMKDNNRLHARAELFELGTNRVSRPRRGAYV